MRFPAAPFELGLLLTGLLLVHGQRPANLANRRKLHRHHCSHRRCMPLHSRVPFP
ncbi:apelin receptor early endogenous ligand-like [Thamnophis elegans]|uniref:apelin receptor early endogenous ligand-like n=1 Tax=Thamnophis elegans TaxID=35005 RepID=UPI001377588B|nr:apelin receptor early endogenous ligand-like [Thamnophis elegans]